jgi:hypothetical protein
MSTFINDDNDILIKLKSKEKPKLLVFNKSGTILKLSYD